MTTTKRYRKFGFAAALISALVLVDGVVGGFIPFAALVSQAEARIGRPATPGSVAGVARRTTRRVVRRSTIYIATLPAGCARVVVNGVALSRCGGTYYQPYGGRYVVVYVN
jgi:hypothetical protein